MEVPILDLGIAMQQLTGEVETGDRYLVQLYPHGVLVVVMDGLGHGSEAAAASSTAGAILAAFAHEPVVALVKRCHQALKGTRGVAMSLASFNTNTGTLAWLGVGNVEGTLLSAGTGTGLVRKSLLLRAGIVGCHLPLLHETVIPVKRGDTLVLATDGISYRFTEEITPNGQPQQIADRILARYSKDNDDAMVLVARYCGAGVRYE